MLGTGRALIGERHALVSHRPSFWGRWFRVPNVVRHPLVWVGAVLAVFFYPEVILGRIFSPADYLFRTQPWASVRPSDWTRPANDLRTDAVLIEYPRLLSTGRDILRFGFTSWQNHTLVGTENSLSLHYLGSVLWPPELAFVFLPPAVAENLFHLSIPAASALAMYPFAKTVASNRPIQFIACVAWAISGYVVVWLSAPALPLTVMTLPLLTRLAADLITSRTKRWWVGPVYALALGWTFFMAYPPANIVLLLGVGCMSAAAFAAQSNRRLDGLLPLIAFTTLGAAVAGLALATDVAEFSGQIGGQFRYVLGPLPKSTLALWLLPNLFGSPVSSNWHPPFDRPDLNFAEVSGYVGAVLAAGAVVGAASLAKSRTWWMSGAVVLSLLAVILGYTVVGQLPVVRDVRPERWLVLTDFGFILLFTRVADLATQSGRWAVAFAGVSGVAGVLAAGLAVLYSALSHVTLRSDVFLPVALMLATSLLVVGLSSISRLHLLPSLLAVTVVVDLVTFGVSFNPALRASEFYPTTPALTYLSKHSGSFRTLVATPDHFLWGGDVLNVYGVDSITGYDHLRHPQLLDVLGSNVDSWEREEWSVWGFLHLGPALNYSSTVLNELGVRFAYFPLGTDGLPTPTSAGWATVYSGPDGMIYENPWVLSQVFESSAAGTTSLHHDLSRPDQDRVKIDGPTTVVWSHGADPGWSATLDGQSTVVHRHDNYFLAVSVPAGPHVVQVAFQPRDARVGMAISLFGFVATVVAGLWLYLRRPEVGVGRRSGHAPSGPKRQGSPGA